MPGTRIICKNQLPVINTSGTMYLCSRNKGHDGEHVDAKQNPPARWDKHPAEDFPLPNITAEHRAETIALFQGIDIRDFPEYTAAAHPRPLRFAILSGVLGATLGLSASETLEYARNTEYQAATVDLLRTVERMERAALN